MISVRTVTKLAGTGTLALAATAASLWTGASSFAATANTSATGTTTASGTRLTTIISKGDSEITRRLTSLNTLTSKINGASKLSASDKSTLSTEVSTTISGLTSLKAKLDAETTATAALTDAKDIYSEYRVYALVTPKINLVKTADDQQAAETKLSALATKLQSRIQQAATGGKDMSDENAKLADMKSQIATSTPISSSVESAVIGLQPSDYNSDHTVLSGYRDKLKTAHTADQAAVTDAKAIITDLKAL